MKKKARDEHAAISEILFRINKPEYLELFEEYEANKTEEARLVKQLDKLEGVLQALAYEKRYKVKLDSFYLNARKAITDPYLTCFLDAIEAQRP